MKSGPGDLLKVSHFQVSIRYTSHPSPSLQSDATHRLAATRRNPSTLPVIARPPRSLPAVDLRQPILLRIRKLLRLGLPVQNGQPLDPLDVRFIILFNFYGSLSRAAVPCYVASTPKLVAFKCRFS